MIALHRTHHFPTGTDLECPKRLSSARRALSAGGSIFTTSIMDLRNQKSRAPKARPVDASFPQQENRAGLLVTKELDKALAECKALVERIAKDCRAKNRRFRCVCARPMFSFMICALIPPTGTSSSTWRTIRNGKKGLFWVCDRR